jgi:hypothetical protein
MVVVGVFGSSVGLGLVLRLWLGWIRLGFWAWLGFGLDGLGWGFGFGKGFGLGSSSDFGFGSRIGWGAGLDGLGVIFRPSEGLVLVKAMAEV